MGFRERIKIYLTEAFRPLFLALSQIYRRGDGPPMHQPARVLILPPVASHAGGSVGDQALLIATLDALSEQGPWRISLIRYHSRWRADVVVRAVDYVPGWNGLLSPLSFLRIVRRHDLFFCIGADGMDGYYSDYRSYKRALLCELAGRMGLRTGIISFSFNESPRPWALKALRRLPNNVRLYARDPISKNRLELNGVKNVNEVVDVAFLLQPKARRDLTRDRLSQLEGFKKAGKVIVGININSLALRHQEPAKMTALFNTYVDICAQLAAMADILFPLLPHDFRYGQSDVMSLERFQQSLPAELAGKTMPMLEEIAAPEVKLLVGQLDFCVAGRMHLIIACLGAGVPTFGFTYQGKYQGLYDRFGLSELLVDANDLTDSKSYAAACGQAFLRRQEIAGMIRARLPEIRSVARANLELAQADG